MSGASDAIVERQPGARPRPAGREEARAIWLVGLGIAGLGVVAGLPRGQWSLVSIGAYPLGIVAILLLERRYPADPAQRVVGVGLAHDAVWIAMKAVSQAVFVGGYVQILTSFHARALGGATIDLGRDLPEWACLAAALVVLDFLRWAQHVLHHKVPVLWRVHAVHHSQRELNAFSDYRIHAAEYLVRPLVLVLPMLVLGLPAAQIAAVSLALKWHGLLQHANIRSDLGPLRHVLVTPQSHRIHHSIESRHADRNYGALLSIWDRLFGTQDPGHREYPRTGITDPHFPVETAVSVRSLLTTPLRQTWYPFRRLGALAAAGGHERSP